MVWEDEKRLFSALQEPGADEEEPVTEKRAAPLLSQDPRVLWLGFPWIPHSILHMRVTSLAFTKVQNCGFGTFLSNSQPETGVKASWLTEITIPRPLFPISM